MNYWMVKFESYTGHGNSALWYETKEAAENVYNLAVEQVVNALNLYKQFSRDQRYAGCLFSAEDCFGTKLTVNLANHTIALNSTDAWAETVWKTYRANKDAEHKYKPIYDEGTKIGIGS